MNTGRLALLIVIGVIGVACLFLSSHAADEAFYWTGLVGFIFAVICLFAVIGRESEHSGG